MATEPTFGITFLRDSTDPRPVVAADLSTIAIVGTAPAADAAAFPLDKAVVMNSSDSVMLTKLGATGTLADAVRGISDQLDTFQIAARLVIVRVTEAGTAAGTIANLVGAEAGGTGLYALLRSGADNGVVPRLVIVPGYTHQIDDEADANAVCAALPGILERLIGHAVVEGPGATAAEIQMWRETLNSERLIPVDCWVKVAEGESTVVRPGAPRVAGIAVRRDYQKGGTPFHSWAMQPIQGIVGLKRNVDFSLTTGASEGQDLLELNVGIAVRGELGVESAAANSGFVFIGTDNAGEDPLWQFYNVTRGRDYIHLGLLKTLRGFLGKYNINGHTIQAVENTASFWLRDLKADEYVLGYAVGFERDKNSPENMRLGKFRIFFNAEEPPVFRKLTVDSRRYRPALVAMLDDLIQSAATITG